MRQRSTMRFRPGLEQFEEKLLLSAGSLTTHAGPQTKDLRRQPEPAGAFGYLAFRVTNTPWQTPYKLVPPFQQVLVQSRQPVPGQVYNVLSITVKNGTSQTFDASSGFTVDDSPGGHAFPILTGNEQWKPEQVIVFYVLTKKYYPLAWSLGVSSSTSAAGHQLSYRDHRGFFSGSNTILPRSPALSIGSLPLARATRWARARNLVCPTHQSTRSSTREPAGLISPGIFRCGSRLGLRSREEPERKPLWSTST